MTMINKYLDVYELDQSDDMVQSRNSEERTSCWLMKQNVQFRNTSASSINGSMNDQKTNTQYLRIKKNDVMSCHEDIMWNRNSRTKTKTKLFTTSSGRTVELLLWILRNFCKFLCILCALGKDVLRELHHLSNQDRIPRQLNPVQSRLYLLSLKQLLFKSAIWRQAIQTRACCTRSWAGTLRKNLNLEFLMFRRKRLLVLVILKKVQQTIIFVTIQMFAQICVSRQRPKQAQIFHTLLEKIFAV